MLVLLTLLTTAYFAGLGWLRWTRRQQDAALIAAAAAAAAALPVEDQPPASAVGWPPGGTSFTSYVDSGVAAIDAFLSEGHAA